MWSARRKALVSGHFAQGNENYGPLTAVEGTAKYAGLAAGTFMRKTLTPDGQPTGPFMSGGFDANVLLNAKFGGDTVAVADQFTIWGTVSNFKRSGRDALAILSTGTPSIPFGPLELNTEKAPLTIGDDAANTETDGTFTGGTATGGGSWGGTFHGPMDEDAPTGVTGTFDAHFNNGHILGAYGARKQEN